jgi:hypothetical protein
MGMGMQDITTYNDKYVVSYDFGDIGEYLSCWHSTDIGTNRLLAYDDAVKEFKTLLADLEEAGLDVEVRAGYEQTLLFFVKAPRDLLGNYVYKSRQVKLYHILHIYHF